MEPHDRECGRWLEKHEEPDEVLKVQGTEKPILHPQLSYWNKNV